MADTFQSVQQLVSELIAYKQANPTKKIAFVLQGGGARAAWYGGVLEAIESEVRKQQPAIAPELRFAPDVLVGNSGGALAAVAYFSDLMNPGTYGRYTSRQSWLWRELATNNEAAYKLLDNAGILELISGSKTGGTGSILPSLSNPHMLYNSLPKVGGIGNMAEKLSPHYNFQALFKSRADLWAAWSDLKTKFDDFKTAMDNLSLPNLIAGAGVDLQQASIVLNSDIDAIRNRADAVRNDVATISGHLSHTANFGNVLTYPDQVPDAFKVPLLRDSAAVAVEIFNTLDHLKSELDHFALTTAEGVVTKILTALQATRDLLDAIKTEISALLNRVLQIVTHLDDVITLIVTTIAMTQTHSSLMNTPGLERAIHEALRQATPATTAPTAKASAMDTAIFTHWNARRAAKALDPNVRAPELILLASNISAGRPTLLCMCDIQTKKSLAKSHTWVVELDHGNVEYLAAKGVAKTATPPPSDPTRWIFGSWPTDQLEPHKEDSNIGATVVSLDDGGGQLPTTEGGLTHVETFTPRGRAVMGGSVVNPFVGRMRPVETPIAPSEIPGAQLRTASVAVEARGVSLAHVASEMVVNQKDQGVLPGQTVIASGSIGAAGGTAFGGKIIDGNFGELVGSPFTNPELWQSGIQGTSLIAAAALTSAAIPLAFPPKYWRFNNAYGETYHHWMVDGGICDNRPIQQAVNAGAECIVSFELTPLSAAIQDIPLEDDRPGIGEVASDSLLGTPMNSAFYRFLETYVGDQSAANPPTQMRLWRLAPAQTAVNAKSIGFYDFNGYWESGQLRMGLFDWFMRGYLDAHAGQSPVDVWNDPLDNACLAYKAIAASFLGQVGNANDKEASPGFFVVDFVNNHPHPGYQ